MPADYPICCVVPARMGFPVGTAGLDPMIGLFHGTYRGKAGLVYDLMEPLRPLVDRKLLEFMQKTTFAPADFILTSNGVCRLNPQLARSIVRITDPGEEIQSHAGLLVSQLSCESHPNGCSRQSSLAVRDGG
jgi:hypothetical protein